MSFLVKAFHLRIEERKLDPNIQKWDVHLLQVCIHTCHVYIHFNSPSYVDDSVLIISGYMVIY